MDGAKRGEKEYACKVLNIGYQNRIGWGFSYRISDIGRDIGDTHISDVHIGHNI